MKDQLIAHWGKILFVLGLVFLAVSASQTTAYKEKVEAAEKKVANALGEVSYDEPFKKNKKKYTDAIYPLTQKYFRTATTGTYQVSNVPSSSSELWPPARVMVNDELIINIPQNSKLKYLKNLNSKEVVITVKTISTFNPEISCEKIPGNNQQLKIRGLKATMSTNPIQVTVFNAKYGDIARFHVAVEQQIKFYYYIPKKSITIAYDEQVLDTIAINWGKASISIADATILKIESYSLLRKEIAVGVSPANVPFLELKNWPAAECPFTFTDTVKPLHRYIYAIKTKIWHTEESVDPDNLPEENVNFLTNAKTNEWLITKTINAQYDDSKTITIGKGKVLVGFTREKAGFPDGLEAELIIKKWHNSQWISGMFTLKNTKKILAAGENPLIIYPAKPKDKTVADQIKDMDLIPVKGIAPRVTIGKVDFKKLPFEIDDYHLFKMKAHDIGEKFNNLLITRNYCDKESFDIVYDNVNEQFTQDCYSFWMIKKNDDYFKGAVHPNSLVIHFGNSAINRKLRKIMAELNGKADPKKVKP